MRSAAGSSPRWPRRACASCGATRAARTSTPPAGCSPRAGDGRHAPGPRLGGRSRERYHAQRSSAHVLFTVWSDGLALDGFHGPPVSAASAAATLAGVRRSALDPGRPFVSPAFDYLVIGGGLSLVAMGALQSGALPSLAQWLTSHLWLVLFVVNAAHFAASTVRLYTKPGALRDLRFLTLGLPFLAFGVLAAAMTAPSLVGRHLVSLYLTWSPYHYAAQAYGIAVLYCHRSRLSLDTTGRRLLRVACLLPFVYNFFALQGAGLSWLAPPAMLAQPAAAAARLALLDALRIVSFAAPLAVLFRQQTGGRAPLPLISLLAVASNVIWLVPFRYELPLVLTTV